MIRSSGTWTIVFSVVMAIGLNVILENEVGNIIPSYEILVKLLAFFQDNMIPAVIVKAQIILSLCNFAIFARHKKTKVSRKARYERKGSNKLTFAKTKWYKNLLPKNN